MTELKILLEGINSRFSQKKEPANLKIDNKKYWVRGIKLKEWDRGIIWRNVGWKLLKSEEVNGLPYSLAMYQTTLVRMNPRWTTVRHIINKLTKTVLKAATEKLLIVCMKTYMRLSLDFSSEIYRLEGSRMIYLKCIKNKRKNSHEHCV